MSSQLLAVQQPLPRPQTAAAGYPARCGSSSSSIQQQPIIRDLKRERTFHNESAWRNQVKKDIDMNNKQIEKSDAHIYVSKRVDPLSNLREVLRTLSNAQAFKYMRQCRLVVAKLKKSWVDVNEEIKSLTKSKEYLESAIDHIRKDIAINKEIADGRIHRPSTEPSQDQVDDILDAEKQNLLNLKKSLELILKPIQDHLYRLDDIRDRLDKLYKERSVVTDLICQSLTKSMRSYDRANQKRNEKSLVSRSQPNMEQSADQSHFMELFDGSNGGPESKSMIGPLSAFTAECIDVMRAAQENIDIGRNLRFNSKQLIKECMENSKMYGNCINDAFVKKIEETLALSKILNLSSAENKLAQNRAVRWQDLNNTAYKYTLGPEKYTNLSTYEVLDRPIMKSFQKHPGNQVPEAQEIIKGTHELKESLAESEKRIKSLKVIGQKLDQKAKCKEAQVELNNALLRKRRELSDHRWAPTSSRLVK